MGELARKLLRYLFTGGAAATVDIGGFALLSAARIPVVPAATCSFVLATVANFFLTAHWVFQASATRKRYVVFLAAALLGLVVNVSLTFLAVRHLGLPRVTAKTLAVGMTFVLNFWINARVVFRERSPRSPAPAGAVN